MNSVVRKILSTLQRFIREEKGLTTVPTIIGTVSAMAVAGSLANAIINEGTDLANTTEQIVQEAIEGIQGTFQLRGGVIGNAVTDGQDGAIGQLTFTVALVSRNGSVDFTPPYPSSQNTGISAPDSENTIVISYSDKYQYIDDLYWTLEKCGKDNGNNLLEGDELFKITIGGNPVPSQDGGNLIDALDTDLSTDTSFSLEIKSARGALLCIERKTPSCIRDIVNFRY